MKIALHFRAFFLFFLALTLFACTEPIEYSLQMRPNEVTLIQGKTTTVKPLLTPYLDGVEYTFKSKDTEVATVSSRGEITAEGKGETRVYVTCVIDGKELSAYCNVTVKLRTIELDYAKVQMLTGDKLTLTATATDGSEPKVSWSSSQSAVATVSSTGLVTAVGAGEAIIKASAEMDGKTVEATCTVTVESTLSLTPDMATIKPGESVQFKTNAVSATFVSSNPDIVSVSTSGLATGRANGEATITATSGSHTATAKVIVAGFAISHSQISLGLGKETQLTTNAEDPTLVQWSSDKPTVVSVSETGLISGLAAGSATITASMGSQRATCVVTVKEPLTLNMHTAEMVQDGKVILSANYPSSDIHWSAHYYDVADGVVTANSWIFETSIVTLAVTAEYEGMVDSCLITCYPVPKFSGHANGEKVHFIANYDFSLHLNSCYSISDFSLQISNTSAVSVVTTHYPTTEDYCGCWECRTKQPGEAVIIAHYNGSVPCLMGRKAAFEVVVSNL